MTDPALVLRTPPDITAEQAAAIARDLFGIDAVARSLGSHQDRNYLLEHADGRALLKIANPDTPAETLELQSSAVAHLAEHAPGIRVPRSRPLPSGGTVATFEYDGHRLHARVLDFLDGSPLSGGGYLSAPSVRAMGALAGRMATALSGFDAPEAERANQWDLRQAPAVLGELLPFVGDVHTRSVVRAAADAAWEVVAKLADDLPVQVIHGDLTDDNVVWSDPVVRIVDGVIDFGDLHRGWAVAEIAILVSSLLHHAQGSVQSVMRAIAAYHEIRPLSRVEAEVLWPLVALRGAVLVASGHHVVATDPGNAYAVGNLPQEELIFERAIAVPLAVASALVLRTVGEQVPDVGLPACRPLVPGLAPGEVALLDLSAESPSLHEGRWLDPDAESLISAEALRAGAAATLTRFAQLRLTRSEPISLREPENAMLGVELTTAGPVAIVAPWDGVVESDADHLALLGNDLVLKLRGVRDSPPAGTAVAAGDPLGEATSRLIVQVERAGADAPLMTSTSLADAWRALVADPTPLVVGTIETPAGLDAAALVARRDRVFARAQEYYFDRPPVIVRGWREYLIDQDGRVYLDVLNNVTAVGHAHPRLVEAVSDQWKTLNTNSRFHYPSVVEFSERLSELLPSGLDTVFLVNSGSEAVDLALRLARASTGRHSVLSMREAYHGWTDLSDAVSTSIADNPNALSTRPDWVHTVDAANVYRGRYRGDDAGRYAEDAVAELERLAAEGAPVGAFIAEAYYGNAGGMALPDGYLDAVYRAVRAQGGLAIADEIQVGYGRLGHWLWGFEQQGVVPDIVTVAKAVGNGQPIGAVITSEEIAESYRSQGYFFSSGGGNPVSCVAGLTVLDILRDEDLRENAVGTGGYLKARLAELGERHPLVGTVHGDGFYLGLEFVRDRETLEPATEETAAICERLRELGVIVQPTSDRQCVLKIKPPMCLTRESADAFVGALDEVLTTGW